MDLAANMVNCIFSEIFKPPLRMTHNFRWVEVPTSTIYVKVCFLERLGESGLV